jgi:hypothetical protein
MSRPYRARPATRPYAARDGPHGMGRAAWDALACHAWAPPIMRRSVNTSAAGRNVRAETVEATEARPWVGGIAAAIAIGAVAGLLPALRTACVSPTQALWAI